MGNNFEGRNCEVVTFNKNGKNVSFTVSALDFGFIERLRNFGVFTIPDPPMVIARDDKGKFIRNPVTNLLERVPDTNDEKYRKTVENITNRFQAIRLYGHLKSDQNIEFEAVEPETDSSEEWTRFADALHEEIVGSGLTEKEMTTLLEKGSEIEAVLVKDEELGNFSQSQEPHLEVPGAS